MNGIFPNVPSAKKLEISGLEDGPKHACNPPMVVAVESTTLPSEAFVMTTRKSYRSSIVAFPKPLLPIEQKSVAGTRNSRKERTTWMSSTLTAASAPLADPVTEMQTISSTAAATARPSPISLRFEKQEIAITQNEDQI